MKNTICITALMIVLAAMIPAGAKAQAGITASPSRLYFSASNRKAQKIVVTNPGNRPLEIGVTISDWKYDSTGNNQIFDAKKLPTSAASSIKVLPGSYFTLKPNEQKELTVQFSDPNKDAPYQTGMIFLTQLNPDPTTKNTGANIKVTVRVGVKVYYTPNSSDEHPMVDIKNLKDVKSGNKKELQLALQNNGKIWADGTCKWELLNTANGSKTKLTEQEFYTLPGDKRLLHMPLPNDLPKGKYTANAVITYGKTKEIKAAELEFEN